MKFLHTISKIFGYNFWKKRQDIKKAKKQQDILFEQNSPLWLEMRELVVFCVWDKISISGGVMSIFNIAKTSRFFIPHVILMTLGKRQTYTENRLFRNNEFIYRFEQLFSVCDKLDKLVLHIPECYVVRFNKLITGERKEKLQKIKNLHINILNQNIELMPNISEIEKLKELTHNLTQTVAHHAYANQEVCNQYRLPLTLIPAIIDISFYPATTWQEKENIIVYSNDKNEYKDTVLEMIRQKLPEYSLLEINNVTFDTYIKIIANAKFTLTFGEGFDAYLFQPFCCGSIGIAVYNETFFPSQDFLALDNIFTHYEELLEQFCDFVHFAEINHSDLIKPMLKHMADLYNLEEYCQKIENFYNGKYDYYITTLKR